MTREQAKADITLSDQDLADIANKIRGLERTSLLPALVAIGGYLQRVFDVIGGDNFCDWVGREFAWSPRSAANYRNVHRFAQSLEAGEYGKKRKLSDLNITPTAIYLLMDRFDADEQVMKETIKRALKSRVVRHTVIDIHIELTTKPDDDEPDPTPSIAPVDVEPERDDDAPQPPHLRTDPLAESLRLLRTVHETERWRQAVAQFGGSDELRRLIDQLERLYRDISKKDAVQAMADAAESRSKLH